jgi:hypothetical protein
MSSFERWRTLFSKPSAPARERPEAHEEEPLHAQSRPMPGVRRDGSASQRSHAKGQTPLRQPRSTTRSPCRPVRRTAITGSDRYDEQLQEALASGVQDPRDLFFELALEDVRRAANLLLPPTRPAMAATASPPSNARPTSRTTPRGPSSRPASCGSDSGVATR